MSPTFALLLSQGTAVPLAANKTCKLIDERISCHDGRRHSYSGCPERRRDDFVAGTDLELVVKLLLDENLSDKRVDREHEQSTSRVGEGESRGSILGSVANLDQTPYSSGYRSFSLPALAPRPVIRPVGSSHSSWRPSTVRSRKY
jgi:hypothetical protein